MKPGDIAIPGIRSKKIIPVVQKGDNNDSSMPRTVDASDAGSV